MQNTIIEVVVIIIIIKSNNVIWLEQFQLQFALFNTKIIFKLVH